MPTTISQNKVKARIEHRCSWCYQKIQVGEVYDRSFNVFDGDAYTFKNHLFCMEVANRLQMFDDCGYEGLSDTDFQESIYWAYKDTMLEKDKNAFSGTRDEMPEFIDQFVVVLDAMGIKHSLNISKP